MTNQPEIKPCPFCGGEAEFYPNDIEGEENWVECCNAKCQATNGYVRRTPEEALSAWNTRTEPAAPAPLPDVEIPEGFKYTPAQQVVWDWWCNHEKAPPICDDLNDLIWNLDALKEGIICNLAAEKLRLTYSLQTCLDVIKEGLVSDTISSATYNSNPFLATLADHFSNAKQVAEDTLELSLKYRDGKKEL